MSLTIHWDGFGGWGNGRVKRESVCIERFNDLTNHHLCHVGTETALNERDPGRAGKSGTLPPTKRTGRSGKHLSRRFGGRAGKSGGLNYIVAGSDGSFQQELWCERYASERNSAQDYG